MNIKAGDKFNRLTYLGNSKTIKHRKYGKFICECGNIKLIRLDSVICGSVKSCGCLYQSRKNTVGLESSEYEKLYNVWNNMMKRCYDPGNDRFYAYGKRGIAVCDEWKSDFRAFAEWAVENGWNSELSIERKNLDDGYCPENCEFITMRQQARNKTSNIRIFYHGEDKCIAEWCEILGLNDKRTYRRYQLGITNPDILFYPGDLRSMKGCG